ncbi:hypothetical protein LTR36_004530 [Oleoguttula mirabilis]|uniref:Uncharacterized protein n=1 Tax=Oleoguttula mirabilis TaxID=1507867 RepID=A0AAV9JG70_9PEZI|nr:hypothetical protein LTR36_004530 [Oleoguttula mirabilis]
MSKAASSPTARLLQSSRLFSLPRPLPQPQLETITSSGVYRASNTATLPYPTHQAVATPPSSHFRGDWGLKRPLPGKATKTSTPHIRISAQDTAEHITDFGSAADHTQTEAKWLEMGVPVMYRTTRDADRKTAPLSVFEEGLDNTDAAFGGAGADATKQRWKYNGPWIAGMQDGAFQLFTRRVEKRKAEFRDFVKANIAEQRLADRRRQAQDEGQVLDMQTIARLRQELRPDESEMVELEKGMRDNHATEGLSSELTALICDFLDLPAVRPAETSSTERSTLDPALRGLLSGLTNDTDIADSAPPSTHPSAGLSYLRTSAIMENHPLHGPQAHRAPVLARVVRPRNSAQGTEYQAKVGVAGIVASDPVSATLNTDKYGRGNGSLTGGGGARDFDPDVNANALLEDQAGGNKMWVHPQTAFIDENGRIRLSVTRGDREAIAIKNNDVEHIHEARAAASRGMVGGGGAAAALPGTSGNANYGHSLPDRRRAPAEMGQMPAFSGGGAQQPRAPDSPDYGAVYEGQRPQVRRRAEVRGFDEELGTQAGEGRMDDESATSRIRELLEGRGRR